MFFGVSTLATNDWTGNRHGRPVWLRLRYGFRAMGIAKRCATLPDMRIARGFDIPMTR
jgi:hypothetical protein